MRMDFDDTDMLDDREFMRQWKGANKGDPEMENYLSFLEEKGAGYASDLREETEGR